MRSPQPLLASVLCASAGFSHPLNLLAVIYLEHGQDVHRMAVTLLSTGVPVADVQLLRLMPWPYLANHIAVERERLSAILFT